MANIFLADQFVPLQYRAGIAYRFNVLEVNPEDTLAYHMYLGCRLMRGRIFLPQCQRGSMYYDVNHLGGKSAAGLWDAVAAELPNVGLSVSEYLKVDREEAIKSLGQNREHFPKFFPKVSLEVK